MVTLLGAGGMVTLSERRGRGQLDHGPELPVNRSVKTLASLVLRSWSLKIACTTVYRFLPPAYVVRWEGNVLTRVCPSINLSVHRGGTHVP